MRLTRNLVLGTVLTAAALLLNGCQPNSPDGPVSTPPPTTGARVGSFEGRYVVSFKDEVRNALPSGDYATETAAARQYILQFLALRGIRVDEMTQVYGSTIVGFAARLSAEAVARLSSSPIIEAVEPDGPVALIFPKAEGVTTSDVQTVPWGITAVGGSVNYVGSAVAWVIDTGIDLTHPDLNVNASRGYNAFTDGSPDAASLNDLNGHGSHVSGTIAAKNNGFGVVGVAAGAQVIPVKVLNSAGSGSYSGVIAGVNYVGANGKKGDVANMSLGGSPYTALDNAVKNAAAKGIYFSLAAGNDADKANNHSPARANGTNIRTVSAHDVNSVFAYFSNYGNPPIEYAAPGVSVYSTFKDGGYTTYSGTSMAAPHVAGIMLANGAGKVYKKGRVTGDYDSNADYKASRVP
ncbi:S8 family serine peptidase [Spirosoma taeanense]|uniref:S8 family serine peptidase n=1 Tax=Spirosoma taeanense TaxID=2735870 RepID=A0A6M5Y6M1_9BACT|nr:S8 family serine peptidase [Spirosoma taeanense]QJW88703.1 S8 family serine peptidase [Spirosoma taeanense]